jgi:hypothetical protein
MRKIIRAIDEEIDQQYANISVLVGGSGLIFFCLLYWTQIGTLTQ